MSINGTWRASKSSGILWNGSDGIRTVGAISFSCSFSHCLASQPWNLFPRSAGDLLASLPGFFDFALGRYFMRRMSWYLLENVCVCYLAYDLFACSAIIHV